MAKILIATIQVNFVLIPQRKLTRIIVILPSTYSYFLATPFDFTTFFTLAILNRAAPFFTAGLFLSIL